MLDSPINPYQPPKAFLGVLVNGGGKLSIVFSIVYYIVMDIVILWFLFFDFFVLGFKVVPVFNALYEGLGSRLPWITRVGLHPFTVKILPFILLIATISLHYRNQRIQKYAKYGLLVLALFASGLFYLILYSLKAPVEKLKSSNSLYNPSDLRPNRALNADPTATT